MIDYKAIYYVYKECSLIVRIFPLRSEQGLKSAVNLKLIYSLLCRLSLVDDCSGRGRVIDGRELGHILVL